MTDADDWHTDAACRGQHHLFYEPEGREPEPTRATREAYALLLCRSCPVRDTFCRDDARTTDQAHGWHGIRAGLRADERRRQDMGRRAPTWDPRCGEVAGYSAHRRRDEFPCGPCKDAHARAKREAGI